MTRRNLRLLGLVLLCLVTGFIQGRAAADKPNFDLFVYRRAYTTGERVSLRLSTYNEKAVDLAAFPVDLRALTPTSKSLEHMKARIAAVNLSGLHAAHLWRFKVVDSYPDRWSENEVKAPRLQPGVYLIRARSGGIEKRTWLAITDIALVTKRSRQELMVYAVNALTGRPQPNIHLEVADTVGRRGEGVTDISGIWRSHQPPYGNLWVVRKTGAMPAFLLTGVPAPPEPYAVHVSTDRPIYRPGNNVLYRGTLRERLETDAPGGFTLRPYAGKNLTVEIRDATDALIARQNVTTNSFGSIEGSVQLASEPPLGRWQIVIVVGKFRGYSSFEVQEYRKPEFTTGVQFTAKHLQGGSTVPVVIGARYFFGQPISGAAVVYNISFSPDDQSGQVGEVEPSFQGQGITGPDGQLSLEIQTKRLAVNRRLTVNATVTDLSRRSQQGEASILITSGRFRIALETDRYAYRVNARMPVTVTAVDYDNSPVAARVVVRLVETKLDRMRRPVKRIISQELTTNAAGKGTVTFIPVRPGNLQLEAEAFDIEQNKIAAAMGVWVAGNEDGDFDYPTLNLIADRHSYRPGETATILINTSLIAKLKHGTKPSRSGAIADPSQPAESLGREQAYALVTIEGERMYSHRTVQIDSKSSSIALPITAGYFPSVQVSVLIVMDKHIYDQEAQLPVYRDEDKLQVTVQPSSDKYKPGESASYTVTTRDYRGRPVPAEVAFDVVDASIYALQPDTTPDLFGTFYGGQQVRIETDFSFAAQYSGGAFQNMNGQAVHVAQGTPPIRVRKQFADTAYWNPSVVTNAAGSAQVSFTLPDNLTTWRATARGITLDTQVGAATNDVISTMPLLVRLELPRFYVEGDEAVVTAIVHNGTEAGRTVLTSIEASGAQLEGEVKRKISLAAGEDVRLDWKAKIDHDAGTVRFLVTADGGSGAQDATELTLPKREDGLPVVEAHADSISDVTGTMSLNLTKLPVNSTVSVSLSPSLASGIFEALDYLQTYPYGCSEQTMSSFLPDLIVARTMHRLNSNNTPRPDLERWVGLGIQKLYRYQHNDGGWNWWEDDQTDGDMTAYVLWGLEQAREAGYLVDDQRLNRGAEALLRMLKGQKELNARADWLLTLAYALPNAIVAQLSEAYVHRGQLDTYALASLGIALAQMRSTVPGAAAANFGQMASTVASELESKAVRQGTTVDWPAAVGGYTWREGDVSVTAHVLRAVLRTDPNSTLIAGAVRWLMGNRTGKAWESTRSSAEAVFALSQVMEQTKELQPNYRVTVTVDSKSVQETSFTDSGFGAQKSVTLTPEMLRGHTTLEVKKQGPGMLYMNTTQAYTIRSNDAVSRSRGLTVRRTFRIAAEDPSHADTIASGQDFDVHTEITADANYRYAVVEDPIPAGCEVGSSESFTRGGYYIRREVRDNRVVFFFNNLPKGKTEVTYRLHAEAPGVYRILPSVGSLAYFPEIRGNSGPVSAKIVEKAP